MKFHTAYIKLTLFYVLIVMIISVTFSVIIYNIASSEIDQGLGRGQREGVFRDIQSNNMLRPMSFEEFRLRQLEESNNHLKLTLLYFNLLILLLSSGVSYFLARKTLEPIEEAMEVQKRFTADASHELRTPLAAMKAEIEVAVRDKNFNLTAAKELFDSNLEEIDKLESLSNSLLKLARAEGQERKNFEVLSLEEAVIEAYQKIESLAREKSIKFENELSAVKIMGEKDSIRELFVILLENAIKYSSAKSKIKIKLLREKNNAIVIVSDNGIGIKDADLPFIFDRFYRVDTARSKEKNSGYGLGLAIAKQIMDLHSGTIKAKSKLGQGTKFVLVFEAV